MARRPEDSLHEWRASVSESERHEQAVAAAKASGEARRAHRLFKDILKEILAAPLETEDEQFAALKKLGLEHPRQEDAVMLAASQKARNGDIEAIRFLRDTLGEKPTEAFNLAVSDRPIKSLDLGTLSDQELEALASRAPVGPQNAE